MKGKMLVIGQYPDEEAAKDGMMQRVLEMDDILRETYSITYLDISFKSYWLKSKKNIRHQDSSVCIWRLNMFLHQTTIFGLLLKSNVVYVHSVMNYFLALPALTTTKCPTFLDIHGIVPEEYVFSGKKFKGFLYSIAEYFAFKKSKYFIAVTRAMREHYLSKYRGLSSEKFIVLPIFDKSEIGPKEDVSIFLANTVNEDRDLTVVYAGGTQAWQNIDYMVNFALAFQNVFKFRFYVPSKATKDIVEKFESGKVVVGSLPKHELMNRYRECGMGFLLRDDIAVNRVASPTKFSEYVNSYIVPVMFDKNVGDIEYYGYSIVEFNDLIALQVPGGDDLRAIAVENKKIYDTVYMLDVSNSYKILIDRLNAFSSDNANSTI
ncbi:glycosyltransferase [Deinococcus sp.]|uniref:glycosyltransferase n=1 Tax=Deinococcus sp. TaxID=47478 RepID=UPI0025DA28D1|nr:glycosyltransferase [Deinococcus sp.]